ncbi:hypothetical protein BLA24_26375 [Streptomyces cinnamoneus]|uniref:Uncharacterized protein n=1 Tax=Streptomyces cinnamoneus TaxID=53446 RepID=A0A2G1XE85_STRCJ|nr:hypothetical protein [Streptomyces cinnamoneus]PHQ49554.1 hypothetical protein BLA24_26375 [Streptomyces cinnamoneus]PPT14725.1 hypothetical protein CYQ11_19265 [Streptomyces cinnamoneus]
MYEPIRTKSVHAHGPHRTRQEELDIRLAGHLTALLTVTDELRALTPSGALDDAARRLALRVERLRGHAPLRAAPTVGDTTATRVASLHQRAHTLAGQALVVATSRGDAAGAALAAERMQAHAAALGIADAV